MERDPTAAEKLFQRAAEQGYAMAIERLNQVLPALTDVEDDARHGLKFPHDVVV